ncbi:hypothetical protein F5887DRAFT_1068378 [Amanita rubescens]|nr:hypothetical protein F5887DRAFT_1068378 [Amanita rubescens]
MAPSHESHEHGSLYLPQYGFGPILDFADLVGCNQFLFRVYTPKERSPFFDDTEPFFIAPKFDERYRNVTPGGWKDWGLDGRAAVANATYEDVATHMGWTTRSSSSYISTSFSPMWSIWEAVRRYHHGVKQDVEIAIIDAHAISDRSVTAASLLSKATSQERHESHWKWFRFSQESQAVLVYGAIPGTAVLASVPLADVLQNLPSYFLKPCVDESNPFHNLAWDHTERKPNFRLFCRDMSSRFLRLSSEGRLRDATTGSVELAIEFLRPWFHRTVTSNSELATLKLLTLAYIIAQWPSQWWILEHSEIWDLSSGMVDAIAGELHEKGKSKDIAHLQEAVDELERNLSVYENQLRYAQYQAVKYHRIASSASEKRTEKEPGTPRRSAYLPTPDASPDRGITARTRNSLPDSPSFIDRNACSKSLLPLLSALASSATAGTSNHLPPSPNRSKTDPSQVPVLPSPLLSAPVIVSYRTAGTSSHSPTSPDRNVVDPAEIQLPPSPLLSAPVLMSSASARTSRHSPTSPDTNVMDPARIPLPPSPLLSASVLTPFASAGTSRHSTTSPDTNVLDPTQIPLPPSPLLSALASSASAGTNNHSPDTNTTDPTQIPLPPSPLSTKREPPTGPVHPLLPTLPITPVSSPKRKYTPLFVEMISKMTTDDATVLATPTEEDMSFLRLTSSEATLDEIPPMDDKEGKEAEKVDATVLQIDDDAAAELNGVDSLDDYEWISEDEVEHDDVPKLPVFVKAASSLATGFLVGAFISLCLFSHRRTMLLTSNVNIQLAPDNIDTTS